MSAADSGVQRIPLRTGVAAVLAMAGTLVVGRLAVALLPRPDGSFADLGVAAATVLLAPVAGLVAALVAASGYRHRRLRAGDRWWLWTATAVLAGLAVAAAVAWNWPAAFVVLVVGATVLVVLRVALIDRSA